MPPQAGAHGRWNGPRRLFDRLEAWLEEERDQIPPWFVVGFAAGIAGWFALGPGRGFLGLVILAAGLVGLGATHRASRLGQVAMWGGVALLLGAAAITARAWTVEAPVLAGPRIAEFAAVVEKVEPRVARGDLRLTLAPEAADLPPRVRVSLPIEAAPQGLAKGAKVRLRARLMPPAAKALPGAHDFARDAWFGGIGGAGRAIGPVRVVQRTDQGGLDEVRGAIGRHIRERLPGPSGGIATALATGDQAAVDSDTAEAMRRSGLAHLLSVSGLHIAAVVGAAMFVALRLMAMSERLALRFNLVLVAAGVGALAGISYTLLTGMQVPTVRSCIAALLVLAGIALGREALSMRLIATGALIILALRPEALMGASFQMSFAAVAVIVALHQDPRLQALLRRGADGPLAGMMRGFGGLLLTGLAVELALIPIGFYHFHKAGLYGVFANLAAIPMTSFLIMPLEALALLLGPVGLDGPVWWLCGLVIDLLLGIAGWVSNLDGAVASVAFVPGWALGCFGFALAWLCLWRGAVRRWALVGFAAWGLAVVTAPVPDLLVTRDGRHLAVVGEDGRPAILRERSGDFTRTLLAEAAGFEGELEQLSAQPYARCNRDSCMVDIDRSDRRWRVLATRSTINLEWEGLVEACRSADIVVSDRRLPRACQPRWLKLDRDGLARLGGVSVYLAGEPRVEGTLTGGQHMPWSMDVASTGR